MLFDRNDDTVERGELVGRAQCGALGAGAVIAADVDDQRVVELSHVLDGLDDATDLVVRVGQEACVHFGLAGEHLLGRASSVSHSGTLSGHGVSLALAGTHPRRFWFSKIRVTLFVVAVVELALELLDPFLGRMMRRVRGART